MQEGDDANGTGNAVRVVGVGVFQQGQQWVDGVVMQVGVAVQDGLVPGDPSEEKKNVVIRLVIVFNTSHNHTKIHVRPHSTVKVIRACMFRMWSVREVSPRVPPTCILVYIQQSK